MGILSNIWEVIFARLLIEGILLPSVGTVGLVGTEIVPVDFYTYSFYKTSGILMNA
jgi:hypothetical protein